MVFWAFFGRKWAVLGGKLGVKGRGNGVFLSILTLLGGVVSAQEEPRILPRKVGETEEVWVSSPRPYGRVGVASATAWWETLEKPGATFVRVHFTADSSLDDDGFDELVLRDPSGAVVDSFRRDEMADRWSASAMGSSMTVEIVAAAGGAGVAIDRVAWGTVPLEQPPPATAGVTFTSICDALVTERVRLGDPVALFTYIDDCPPQSVFQCTGFLFSPQGHFMTNAHCANSATEAASVEVQFNHQEQRCSLLGRPQPEVFVGSQFYAMGCPLDYSVLVLKPRFGLHAADLYGHFQVSGGLPGVGEELWIPQHPNGVLKRISEDCSVMATGVPGFNACADPGPPNTCANGGFPVANSGDIAFDCVIQSGSSGSPVLDTSNRVIALAHAGSVTQNYGVRMDLILANLPNRPLTLTIHGPDAVDEGSITQFTATATHLTTSPLSATTRANWSVTPPTAGSIGSGTTGGRFAAALVDGDRLVTIGASYTSSGVTVTTTKLVRVVDVPATIEIVGSDPPGDSIDAGRPVDPATLSAEGWRFLTATFDGDVSGLSTGHFSIEKIGMGTTPVLNSLVPIGFEMVQLGFSSPIPAGAWTVVRHVDSGSAVRLGFLPGDVDGDGVSSAMDVAALAEELRAGMPTLPGWSRDLDRSGFADLLDLMTAVELLIGSEPFEAWEGVSLP